MAKKKVSQKPSEDTVKADREIPHPMDSEASEKLENLKSLNQMLLKEAFERRQQVDTLVQSKGVLESELTRSNSERDAVRSELNRLGERAVRLELERSVVAVFVAVQVGLKGEESDRKTKGLEMETAELKRKIDEKEGEIVRLNVRVSETEDALGIERGISKKAELERDDLGNKLNLQIEENKGLSEKLIEYEKRKKVIEREIDELRAAHSAVIGEKEDVEMRVKSLIGEVDTMKRGLRESNKSIDQIKEELLRVIREKEGIEEEKNVELSKRKELENAVNGLNEFVANLQKEEAKLRAVVAELEKKCAEGEERQNDLGREIDELVEEKKLDERRIQGLVEEKTAIKNDLNEALKNLGEQKQKIEEMVSEKIVMMEAKDRVDSEVGELRYQVDALRAVVEKFEEANRAYVEEIKKLESEVGEYKSKLYNINLEMDGTKHSLEEEKQNAVILKAKIGELEREIKKTQKNAEEVKAEKDSIYNVKKDLESRCEMLKNEITSLQNSVTEAQNGLNSMKGKVESADANSELVLNMLKGTAAFCKNDGETGDVHLLDDAGEVKPYVKELEVIKKAFKGKVGTVEEMKRQMECLKNSVEVAHKKKSFWTALSSATTLLAAVSLAYVARAH